MLSPKLDSIFFDQDLFDAANFFDDISYDDFIDFNSKHYKGPFEVDHLNLILKAVCFHNNVELDPNIKPNAIFEIASIPVYIFEDKLPINPQSSKQELTAGATYIPKLGIMVVEKSVTQAVFYHEIIHAYQYMLESISRFPKYRYHHHNNPIIQIWTDFATLFNNKNERLKTKLNNIFFNIRKEVHAYQIANHGTLTNGDIDLCIIRITSKNYGMLVQEYGEKNVCWLVHIVYIMVLCNLNVLNPDQQKQVINKMFLTADFQEYLIWQQEFVLQANVGDVAMI